MTDAVADAPRRQDSFVFEVTQRCNHDCLHCYNAWKNHGPYPQGELDTAGTLSMLGRMLDQTGAGHVTLSGGEPLLRGDLLDIVGFLNGRHVGVNLISNGGLLTGAAVQSLAGRISVFEIPLLSSDRDIHDRLSACPGAFDRATLAIAELKAARQSVAAVFVATRLNLPTWRETIELAFALGVDALMFNRFNPGGRGFDHLELLQASPADVQAGLDIAEESAGRFDLPISCSIAHPPCLFDISRYKRLSFGFCAAATPRAYYTLDPLGNLRPCNHSPRILGNIFDQTFWAMHDGELMRQFAQARPAFCADCGFEAECQGGCKAAAEACYGCVTDPDPFLAAFQSLARKPARGPANVRGKA